MPRDDDYTMLVAFRRSHSEDDELAGTLPDKATALRRQLASELQEACDNGMAGEFVVFDYSESGLSFEKIKASLL